MSGIYVGVVTTPRKLQFDVEGKNLLPRMCGRLPTTDYVWDIFWNDDDTKEAPIQCRRGGVATRDVW